MKPTTVINKYHKLPFDVFIGRGSKWGNPFSHMDGTKATYKVETREEAVESYREWIHTQPALLDSLYELKGKVLCCYCKPKPCHGDILSELADALPPRLLECSTEGDKRFSDSYAKVNMWGRWDTIENHYQSAKVSKPDPLLYIELNGKKYDAHYLPQWYKLLWIRYLDCHPELVRYAKNFDEFINESMEISEANNQAKIIQQYIEEGRDSIWKDCEELWGLFQNKK